VKTENIKSSTKPEVHNLLQRHQRTNKPGPWAMNKKFSEVSRCSFRVASRQTDRQTNDNQTQNVSFYLQQ